MILKWKEYNINLNKVNEHLRDTLGVDFYGNTSVGAGSVTHEEGLHLHLSNSVSEEQKAVIQAYWDGITEESEEVITYQSKEQIAEALVTKKASGLAKLVALGLTEDEAKALVG